MEKVFYVPQAGSPQDVAADKILSLPAIRVDNYMWMDNGCTPEVSVRIYYTADGLGLYFTAREKDLRATCLHSNDAVCCDSCMEFFFSPNPDTDPRYMNVETNPFGTMLIGLGGGRHDSKTLSFGDSSRFAMEASVTPENLADYKGEWTLRYFLDKAFLEESFGALIDLVPGKQMRANFYKCGDHTPLPHYGSWNPVDWPTPDFHRPEFFGRLILL